MELLQGGQDVERGNSLRERIANIFQAAKEDFQGSDHKLRTVAWGASALAMQAFDRARGSVMIVPTVAANTLHDTGSPVAAGLAAGLVFAGMYEGVGGATTEALHKFPTGVRATERNFPGLVGFFGDSLRGLEKPQQKDKNPSLPKRVGHRVTTGLARGFTVSGIGNSPYVTVAAAKGWSRSETHRLSLNSSLDGGVAVGGIVFGLGEVVVNISSEHPKLAEDIQNTAGNVKLWLAVAVGLMATQFISNRLKKRAESPEV